MNDLAASVSRTHLGLLQPASAVYIPRYATCAKRKNSCAFLAFLAAKPISKKAARSFTRPLLTFAGSFGSSLLIVCEIRSRICPSLGDSSDYSEPVAPIPYSSRSVQERGALASFNDGYDREALLVAPIEASALFQGSLAVLAQNINELRPSGSYIVGRVCNLRPPRRESQP